MARGTLAIALAIALVAGCGDDDGPQALRADELTANGRPAQPLSSCLPVERAASVVCADRPAEPIRATLPARAGSRVALRLGLAAREATVHLERDGELVGRTVHVAGQARARERSFTLDRVARTGDVVLVFLRYEAGGNATFALLLRP